MKLSTEAAMAGVEAPLMVAWELTVEGKEKGKERRGMGARPRGTAGAPMEGGSSAHALLCPAWCACVAVRGSVPA
jgi:hypothetical protein